LNILLVNQCWFKDELIALGHTVLYANWKGGGLDISFNWNSSVEEVYSNFPSSFIPDRIIYFDDSGIPSIFDIENAPCPTLFMSVDTHHHYYWHKYFLQCFSHSLIAQKDYFDKFSEDSKISDSISWFPLWASKDITPNDIKDINVSFRGTLDESLHPSRLNFFNSVAKHIDIDYAEGPYSDVYSRSKIVLNEAVRGDLNFRVFEAMMSGAMLVTPRVGNGLEELFIDGHDLVLYEEGNDSDAIERLRYYLDNDFERERIACNGRRKVIEYHSLKSRAKRIEGILVNLKIAPRENFREIKIKLLTQILRFLWIYIRKYNTYSIIPEFEKMLEEVEELVAISNPELNIDQDMELSIFTLDSICSDLLTEESYNTWLTSLNKGYKSQSFVELISLSQKQQDAQNAIPTGITALKEARSRLLRSFID